MDPQLSYNPQTGKHSIKLVDGDPVMDDSPFYEILSMLTEGPGWPMEETPRRGSLADEFPEATSVTPSRFRTSIEERCAPLVLDRTIESATCQSVTQPTKESIAFALSYVVGGKRARDLLVEIKAG